MQHLRSDRFRSWSTAIACGVVLGAALGRPADATGQVIPSFDGARAFELLEKQVEFGPRVPGTPAHAQAIDWYEGFLRSAGASVARHSFTVPNPRGGEPLALTNVWASFAPQASARVALAAHFDCRPVADMQPGGEVAQGIPGANDGASGVAVLLALAEIFSTNPPPVGVDLLLFDGEDHGVEGEPLTYSLGSQRFVSDHPQFRPRALILLDMVGDADLRIPMEQNSLERAPQLAAMVFQRAESLGLGALEMAPGRSVMDDHIPFLRAGIPAIDLIDMDYEYWHTLEDTPDKCSAASLEEIGSLLLALLFLDFAH